MHAGLYPRYKELARWQPATAEIDPSSVRITEAETGEEIGHVFVALPLPGELRWLVRARLEPLQSRRFQIYFNLRSRSADETSGEPVLRSPLVRDASVYLPAEPENLVRNPGFEDSTASDANAPAEWLADIEPTSKGTLRLVKNPVRSGQNALRMEGKSGLRVGVRQRLAMKPNTLYRVALWARADARNRNELMILRILLSLTDAEGRRMTAPNVNISITDSVPRDRWKALRRLGLRRLRSDLRTPPETAFGDLKIQLMGEPRRQISLAGAVYVDDVELIEVKPQALVPPAKITAGAIETRPRGSK